MIELRNISQRFAGPRGWVEALHNVNLAIPPGEVFGIIGRSGAGKSTLVRTINLLTRPTEGNVLVGGRDLTTMSAAQLFRSRCWWAASRRGPRARSLFCASVPDGV